MPSPTRIAMKKGVWIFSAAVLAFGYVLSCLLMYIFADALPPVSAITRDCFIASNCCLAPSAALNFHLVRSQRYLEMTLINIVCAIVMSLLFSAGATAQILPHVIQLH